MTKVRNKTICTKITKKKKKKKLFSYLEAPTVVVEGTKRIFLIVDYMPKAHQPISFPHLSGYK
ncbi:hypothetical protein HanLR1_Chr14g0522061 [Helianthus annuus]|nr:hypothetical protein HanLR1_Chr14g0522061 [Helianthus annuus]